MGVETSSIGRSGRRRQGGDTRTQIVAAAREAFAARGLDGATIREIAGRAGVNPALVLYYFGSKQQLFVAAVQLPGGLPEAIPQLLAGPRDEIGERCVRLVLDLWDAPETRPLVLGLVRSASTDPLAAGMLRELIAGGPILALTTAIDRPDAALRATLAGSQIVGLMLARYVVAVEPLASADRETLVQAMAPTLQRYLTGNLRGAARSTHIKLGAGP